MRALSRRWTILNYIVSEPDEWTARSIADDLEDSPKHIGSAVRALEMQGLLVKGKHIGRARALFPTPAGVEALYESI